MWTTRRYLVWNNRTLRPAWNETHACDFLPLKGRSSSKTFVFSVVKREQNNFVQFLNKGSMVESHFNNFSFSSTKIKKVVHATLGL